MQTYDPKTLKAILSNLRLIKPEWCLQCRYSLEGKPDEKTLLCQACHVKGEFQETRLIRVNEVEKYEGFYRPIKKPPLFQPSPNSVLASTKEHE